MDKNVNNIVKSDVGYDKDVHKIYLYMKDDGSDYKWLAREQYKYISYINNGISKILNEKEQKECIAHIIEFELTDEQMGDCYFKLFKNILDTYINKLRGEDIVRNIIHQFQTLKNNVDLIKLHGDIGEAIFIKKLIDLGYINEIQNAIDGKTDHYEIIDFQFKNRMIEITTTSKSNKIFKISQNQLNKNTLICVFTMNYYYIQNNDQYKTIINIYDEIKKKIKFPYWLESKYMQYSQSDLTIKNKVNLNEISCLFYNYSDFPQINLSGGKEDIIKDIILAVNATSDSNDFEEKIKNWID